MPLVAWHVPRRKALLGGMIPNALLMPNLTACLFPLGHAPPCLQPRVPEATLESGAQEQLHGPGERQLKPAAHLGQAACCHLSPHMHLWQMGVLLRGPAETAVRHAAQPSPPTILPPSLHSCDTTP